MGVIVNLYLLSAYLLILSVHYGSVYGEQCEKRVGPMVAIYNCPENMYCCDTGEHGCCPVFFTTMVTIVAFIVVLVIAVCIVCCWCIFVRKMVQRWGGTVCTHERVTVVSGGPCQNSPQGQPDCCLPAQPTYPPKAPFDTYPGVQPPAYQPSAPTHAVNPQVMPPAPIGFIPTSTKE